MRQSLPHLDLSPNVRARLEKVVSSAGLPFGDLVSLAELSPGEDFIGADLQNVDFGSVDLDQFNLTFANLNNADLSSTHLGALVVDGASVIGTQWPPSRDFAFEECFVGRVSGHIRFRQHFFVHGEHTELSLIEWFNVVADGLQLTLSGCDLREEFVTARSLVDELGVPPHVLALAGLIYTKSDFEKTFKRARWPHTRGRTSS
jgi:hypothetical protein